jgi:hypothetical protein
MTLQKMSQSRAGATDGLSTLVGARYSLASPPAVRGGRALKGMCMSTAASVAAPSLSWRRALVLWWSFFWRAFLYGVVLGMLLGGMAGFYAVVSGASEQAAVYGSIAGWVATLPASLLALKQAVSRHLGSLTA